jgi:hypothetical protein
MIAPIFNLQSVGIFYNDDEQISVGYYDYDNSKSCFSEKDYFYAIKQVMNNALDDVKNEIMYDKLSSYLYLKFINKKFDKSICNGIYNNDINYTEFFNILHSDFN